MKSSIGNKGGCLIDDKCSVSHGKVSCGKDLERFERFLSSAEYKQYLRFGKRLRKKFLKMVA